MLMLRFSLSEKNGQIDSMSVVERRESSFDVFTAQTSKMFRGRQGFPSLTRWRMSLKIARNGEIPMPPATKIRCSYLQNKMVK
jgi:hypothetical protein